MNAGPLIFLAAMAAVFWFLLIRPQRQRAAAHRALIADLAVDDEILTAGGLIGRVRSIGDEQIVVEIAPGTEVRVAKPAITGLLREQPETPAPTQDPG